MSSKQGYRTRQKKRDKGRAGQGGRGHGMTESGHNVAQGAALSQSPPAMVIRNRPLFGYTTKRSMYYYTSGGSSSGAATNNAYVFQANGCYDPDTTGTGGQPMGFDQMMLFYNHYVPIRAKLTVLANNASTTNFADIGITVSANSTVITDYSRLVEAGDITFHQLGFNGTRAGCCKISRTVDIAKFEGVRQILDDPTLRGDASANPTEGVYFHLNIWNPFGVSVVDVNWQAYLEFEVIFVEPRVLTRSLRKTPEVEEKVELSYDHITPTEKRYDTSTVPIAFAFLSNFLQGRML